MLRIASRLVRDVGPVASAPLNWLEAQASRHSMALRAARARHFVLSYSDFLCSYMVQGEPYGRTRTARAGKYILYKTGA